MSTTRPEEMITMETTSAQAVRWLTPSDRCDRCGAQAYVVAVFDGGHLVFCVHHGRQYSAALEASAVLVHDESDQLLAA
jgi:hypothetical protein